jgi:hypothetical protein
MSADFISRIIGMFVLAVGGLILGVRFATLAETSAYLYGTTFMLVGALAGLTLTPYLTVRPLQFLRQKIHRMPVQHSWPLPLG